jgi:hypothetical protein
VFLLRIIEHPAKRFNYAIFKRRKLLWWEHWDWRVSTWHVELAEHYMDKYGMTKENTLVQRHFND